MTYTYYYVAPGSDIFETIIVEIAFNAMGDVITVNATVYAEGGREFHELKRDKSLEPYESVLTKAVNRFFDERRDNAHAKVKSILSCEVEETT